jgi:hypothetical protein
LLTKAALLLLLPKAALLLPEPARLLTESTRLLTESTRLLTESTKLLTESSRLLAHRTRLLTETALRLIRRAEAAGPGTVAKTTCAWSPEATGARTASESAACASVGSGPGSATGRGATHPALRDSSADRDDLEVVAGNWILVLLPQKFLVDQHVDVWREGVGELTLKQHDGALVLLAAPNQLLLALAPRGVAPHRECDRHHHAHDTEAHEQRCHRVAALLAPSVSSTILTG